MIRQSSRAANVKHWTEDRSFGAASPPLQRAGPSAVTVPSEAIRHYSGLINSECGLSNSHVLSELGQPVLCHRKSESLEGLYLPYHSKAQRRLIDVCWIRRVLAFALPVTSSRGWMPSIKDNHALTHDSL
jgi:hypothetical protein